MKYDVIVHSGFLVGSRTSVPTKEAVEIVKGLISDGWSRCGKGHYKRTVGGYVKQNTRFFKHK